MRQPTIHDVAARAGVSKSLVSRVLRGEATVSDLRRRAVLDAVEALGYRPNAAARSLVQRRSHTIGAIVSDLHNPFHAEILDGIDRAASARGFRVLIAAGRRDAAREEEALATLLELPADGVVLVGALLPEASLAAAARSVPVALVARTVDLPGVDTVRNDDVRGAGLAVEHLAALGHRRIAHVDGGAGAGAEERRRGYREAMARHGLAGEVRVAGGDFTEDGGYRGARSLLAAGPRPTALWVANDVAGLGALNALAEAGLAVPRDVSLVGYDNIDLSALRHISLTTVHQPRREMGESATEALLARLDARAARPRRTVLAPTLVVRGTTAPVTPARTTR